MTINKATPMSSFAPADGWQTRAIITGDLGSQGRPRVIMAMFEMAQAIGQCDIKGFTCRCACCGDWFPLSYMDLGHYVSAANGGYAHPANFLPTCSDCNSDMGDTDYDKFCTPHYDSRDQWTGILPNQVGSPRKNPNLAAKRLPPQ